MGLKFIVVIPLALLFTGGPAVLAREQEQKETTVKIGYGGLKRNPSSESDPAGFETVPIPDYFVLGTLYDYWPHIKGLGQDAFFDQYTLTEDAVLDYMTEYIREHYGVDLNIDTNPPVKLLSEEMAGMVARYLEPEGKITPSVFETDEHVYSYFAGVFLRHGHILEDNIYYIQIYNSTRNRPLMSFLLDKMVCSRYDYAFYPGTPGTYRWYFRPTTRMKKYLDKYIPVIEARDAALKAWQVMFLCGGDEDMLMTESQQRRHEEFVRAIKIFWGEE